jgi:hypothetical protein
VNRKALAGFTAYLADARTAFEALRKPWPEPEPPAQTEAQPPAIVYVEEPMHTYSIGTVTPTPMPAPLEPYKETPWVDDHGGHMPTVVRDESARAFLKSPAERLAQAAAARERLNKALTAGRGYAYRGPAPDSDVAAFRQDMAAEEARCRKGPGIEDIEPGPDAFYYPVAWLDKHCERVQSQMNALLPGSMCTLTLSCDMVDWPHMIAPVAWAIEVHDDTDYTKKLTMVMCGATIRGCSQFSFWPGGYNFDKDRTQGIDTGNLRVIEKHGFPCAPACNIGVFGNHANNSSLVVQLGNPNNEMISGCVTVWGKKPEQNPCFGMPRRGSFM